MTRLLLIATFISLSFSAWSQEKVTINGYIKDSHTGEELIGVNVYVPQLKAGTVTNPYGFYSITLEKGSYDLQFSYVGYQVQIVNVDLTQNTSRNIEMASEATYIKEVVVSDKAIDANVVDVQMSRNTINMEQVKKLPALFGEVDIIKNIQMLPGVISAGEGTSSFYVRGGSADQNLILIDEAPIYDPSHLGGLISVFNADVIKDSELFKGGIPARYGGRLSSMLDVRTKDGNNKKLGVSAGLGTLASRLMVEGPIKKDKSSFIVSGRASNLGLYLKAANTKNGVSFYDINGKVNWRANNNNRFFVAFYSGRDKITFNGGDAGFGWGNSTGTFRWNHLFNEKLFSNTTVIASQFDYSLEVADPVLAFKWTSKIQEVSVKNDLTYYINTNNELSFGYHITGRKFQPGRIDPTSDKSIFEQVKMDQMYGLDHGLYLSDIQRFNERLTVDYGVRLSVFQNLGKADVFKYKDIQDNTTKEHTDTLHYKAWDNVKVYPNLEPRVGIRYLLKEGQSLKLSYNRMAQNTHLISAGTVPLPFNTWSPSSYYLKPQLADQVAAGYFRNMKDNMYEVSVETYYKDMRNVTDFVDNAQIFFNKDIANQYRQGKSWSYGAEFMVNKTKGRLNGMVSYTLSKTERKIPGVNNGMAFPSNYDRRHVVNMQAVYEVSKRWTFGANFIYNTGRPITLPAGKYEYQNYHPDVITERNGYRLPAVHRLDFSATLTPRKNENRKWKSQWIFSVYNVYNRKNPFTIYTRTKQDKDGNVIGDGNEKEARMIYLFPLLPSVTYNVKF